MTKNITEADFNEHVCWAMHDFIKGTIVPNE